MVEPVLQRFCKMGETKTKHFAAKIYFFFPLDPRLPVMTEGFGEHDIEASLLSSQNS